MSNKISREDYSRKAKCYFFKWRREAVSKNKARVEFDERSERNATGMSKRKRCTRREKL